MESPEIVYRNKKPECLSEGRQEFYGHIFEMVQEHFPGGVEKALYPGSGGSVKDVWLTTRADEMVLIDYGSYEGKQGNMSVKEILGNDELNQKKRDYWESSAREWRGSNFIRSNDLIYDGSRPA